MMWTLESAQAFVSELQPKAWAVNWNLCIGGGVLNSGHSAADLDLVAIPTKRTANNRDVVGLFIDRWQWTSTHTLPCSVIYRLYCEDRIIELLVVNCGQDQTLSRVDDL